MSAYMYKIRTGGETKKMRQQSLNSDNMYMMRTVHMNKSVKLYAISSEILHSIDFCNILTKVKLQKHTVLALMMARTKSNIA